VDSPKLRLLSTIRLLKEEIPDSEFERIIRLLSAEEVSLSVLEGFAGYEASEFMKLKTGICRNIGRFLMEHPEILVATASFVVWHSLVRPLGFKPSFQ